MTRKWQKKIMVFLSWNLHSSYSIFLWIYNKQCMFIPWPFCYLNNKSREQLPKCEDMIIRSYPNPFSAYTFYHLFNTRKTSFLVQTRQTFFLACENTCWCLWLAQTHLHNKIHDMAFEWVSLRMHTINYVI